MKFHVLVFLINAKNKPFISKLKLIKKRSNLIERFSKGVRKLIVSNQTDLTHDANNEWKIDWKEVFNMDKENRINLTTYIPVADYGRPGTPELAQSVVEPLQISDAVLMESHGVLAVDKDLKEALLKAHYVEETAEVYYRTLVINGGQEPPVVPKSELQKWEYPKEINLLKK